MGYINGRGNLVRKVLISSTPCAPGLLPCPICKGKVEWVTSILVKLRTGFGQKWIEDKDNPNLQVVNGQLIETFVMKKVYFPKTETARICGSTACLKSKDVVQVLAETERNSHAITDGSEKGYSRGSKEKGDLVLDPSWMTSRGKRF